MKDRENRIYRPTIRGLQQLLEKQPNYVETLQGMRVTVMRFLFSNDFHWAGFLTFQKSPSVAILDHISIREFSSSVPVSVPYIFISIYIVEMSTQNLLSPLIVNEV